MSGLVGEGTHILQGVQTIQDQFHGTSPLEVEPFMLMEQKYMKETLAEL